MLGRAATGKWVAECLRLDQLAQRNVSEDLTFRNTAARTTNLVTNLTGKISVYRQTNPKNKCLKIRVIPFCFGGGGVGQTKKYDIFRNVALN